VIAALVLVLCIDALVLRWWWGQGSSAWSVQVSRETTYILEPLFPDGLPDYRAFLRMRQIGPHPRSSNAVLDLYEVFGTELFREDKRAWAMAELGLSGEHQGEFVRTEAYARAACRSDEQRCKNTLDDALGVGCAGLSGASLELTRAWIAANERALDAARRVGDKPMLYAPIDELSNSSLRWSVLVPLHTGLACRGMLRAEQGAHAAAAGDVVALWKLGELSRNDHGLLPVLIGFKLIDLPNQVALKLAASDELPPSVVDQLLRSIPIIDDRALTIAWVNHERVEALLLLISAVRARKMAGAGTRPGRELAKRAFDLETVLRRVNDSFDRLEGAANAPSQTERLRALSTAVKLHDEGAKRRLASQRRLGRLEPLACAVPFAGQWCTLNERIADTAVFKRPLALGSLAKIHEKMAAVEVTRQALVAARAKLRP